jgi:PIN domain nuclease of toxin-antitoxin system
VDVPSKLNATAATELRSLGNDLLLGAGTLWEISINVEQKKLHLSQPFRQWMTHAIADLGLTIPPLTFEAPGVQAGLPFGRGGTSRGNHPRHHVTPPMTPKT